MYGFAGLRPKVLPFFQCKFTFITQSTVSASRFTWFTHHRVFEQYQNDKNTSLSQRLHFLHGLVVCQNVSGVLTDMPSRKEYFVLIMRRGESHLSMGSCNTCRNSKIWKTSTGRPLELCLWHWQKYSPQESSLLRSLTVVMRETAYEIMSFQTI